MIAKTGRSRRRSWWELLIFFSATLLHPGSSMAQAPDETTGGDSLPPQLVTLSHHERSVLALQSGDRPHFVLYARGTLSAELSVRRPSDSQWIWTGYVEHVPPGGETQRHELSLSSDAQDEISLNGKTIPIPNRLAEDSEDQPRGPWFVLTSYGRAVPTGRWFRYPEASDLDHERQYSLAYYADRDVYEAETHRNTLELDDLEGWVLAWDQQHCISHSDGARVARLRVFSDGRIISSRGPREPIVERQMSPEAVQSLVNDMLDMARAHSPDPVAKVVMSESTALQVFPSALGHGLWDQHQDLVQVQHDDNLHSMRVVHPGRRDRVGRVPAGWDEMREQLWKLTATVDD